MSNFLRIIFAGTSDFSAYHLDVLLSTRHQIVGVFTQPDRPSGRGKRLTSSRVKKLAFRNNLPIFQPHSLLQPKCQGWVSALSADIIVVVAYGLIFPQSVLDLPRLGCINVHGSLLPRWRGAAPVQRALLAGDDQTGVTIIQMDAGLDTGAILHRIACPIQLEDTSATLYKKLAQVGSNALLATLEKLTFGCAKGEVQNNTLATYAHKLTKKEARLDWRLPAKQLERCIRAFNPSPISYFMLEKPIKVWEARFGTRKLVSSSTPGTILNVDKTGIYIATGDGKDILIITRLQPAGKKPMEFRDLLNAHQAWFSPGMLLS